MYKVLMACLEIELCVWCLYNGIGLYLFYDINGDNGELFT